MARGCALRTASFCVVRSRKIGRKMLFAAVATDKLSFFVSNY
jgi:hypothetical protein